MSDCPPLGRWEELARGECAAEAEWKFRAHLGRCTECRQVYESVGRNDRLLGSLKAAFHDADWPSSPVAPVGLRIGQFEVTGFLGAGGMATVYRATQDHPRRTVALKVMRQGFASRAAVRRFEHEAELLGRLRHPGIAHVYEAGVAEVAGIKQPYFAMELIEGERLNDYAAAMNLSTGKRLELVARIGEAVHYAHQKGIIHRDLKPSNILIAGERSYYVGEAPSTVGPVGQPKILDFGIARATDVDIQATTLRTDIGQLVGTIPYMSPEQAAGDSNELDVRSDLYSLGVVCYELLAGRLPYSVKDKTVPQAVRVIQEDDPMPLSSVNRVFRGDLETIVAKALEKDKERRYPSVSAFVADIRRYSNDEPVTARPPSATYQLAKFARRNRVLVGGVVSVFVALVLGLIGTGYGVLIATAARNRAVASERAEQARRAEAEAVVELLTEMLGSADPQNVKGADYTVRQQLDDFAKGLGERLAGQPEVAATIHAAVGNAYRGLGVRDKTELHLKAALDLRRTLYAPRHAALAQSLYDYGWCLRDNADYSGAERMFRESLEMRRGLLGGEHEDVANTLDSLAEVLREQQRPQTRDEAEPLVREALAMRRTLFGPVHLHVAQSLNTLGSVLRDKASFEEAESCLREAIAIWTRIYGRDHPEVSRGLSNLAELLHRRADYDVAVPVFEEALTISRKTLGADHHDVGMIIARFGILLRDKGEYSRAEAMLRQAIAMGRAVHGEVHVCVAWQEYQLGVLQRLVGEYEPAQALLQRVFDIYRRLEGDDSLLTNLVRVALAEVLIELGSVEEAERLVAEAIPRLRARYGDKHRHVADALRVLGLAMLLQGNPGPAEPLLREGVRVLRELPYTDAWRVARTESALGACLVALKRFEDAEPLLLQSYSVLLAARGPGFCETLATRQRLSGLYEAWGKPEQAGEFQQATR